MIKTAVFGSAFNPPHGGHLDVIEQALAVFEQVILVPSYQHAFGKSMAPFELRVAMAQALIAEQAFSGRVQVSDIEAHIAKRKPNQPIYTYDVLCEFEALHPDWALKFVVGPDNADPEVWQKFYQHQAIDKRWGRWHAKEQKPIRSTLLRAAIANGEPISPSDCPPAVLALCKSYFANC